VLLVKDDRLTLTSVLITTTCSAVLRTVGLGRPKQDRVIGVSLDMLLEILRALESLAAEVALVRLEWNVDTNVRGDVITLHSSGTAVSPLASEVEIVRALATDMPFADVVLIERSVSCDSMYEHGDGFVVAKHSRLPPYTLPGHTVSHKAQSIAEVRVLLKKDASTCGK